MIRFATHNDIKDIITLWHEAFGDAEAEIKFFLENKFCPDNTLVVEENSGVVSMLFLIEGNLQINSKDYHSYYLYAACTSKSCRGRGLMAELLEFAANTAKSRNIHFICLMPGEKSLFDFYSKHGYVAAFSKKILKIGFSEIDAGEFSACNSSVLRAQPEFLRNNAFSNYDYFKWNNDAINFAFEHTKLYGGQVFESTKGYALYSFVGSDVVVKEFAFTHDFLPFFAADLRKNLSFDNLIFYLPADYPADIGNCQIVKSAMLLPITDIGKNLSSDIKNAYLGLTLD